MERPQELAKRVTELSGEPVLVSDDVVSMDFADIDGEISILSFGLDRSRGAFFTAVVSNRGENTTKRDATTSEVIALKEKIKEKLPNFSHLGILQNYSQMLEEADRYLRY